MSRNNFFNRFLIACLALLAIQQAHAQYLFSESFSNPAVLSKTGWYSTAKKDNVYRDSVNAYQVPGPGALHVSFPGIGSRNIDTLILPVFSASMAGDSFMFDHAHRTAGTRDTDSMSVFYSTNNGANMQLLRTYAGNIVPGPSTLSTVTSGTGGGRFIPFSPSHWVDKRQALPVGTNAIMLVFYSGASGDLYLDNIRVGKQPMQCFTAPVISSMPSVIQSCIGTSFYILPDSFVVNPFITYEWKRSLDNGVSDPWVTATNGFGTHTPEFYLTNFSQAYWYRLEATCGIQTVSPSVHVVPDSSYNCYCATNLGGYCNAWITNVSMGSNLNNSSVCGPGPSDNVFNFYPPGRGTTDTLTAGDPYASISVSTDLFGSWLRARVGFWIDYNRDGIYDSTEFAMLNTNATTQTSTLTFKVPDTAATGLTGLRIRAVESQSFLPAGSFQLLDGRHACTNGTSGEVEDYLIYINPRPACTMTPVAGTFRDTFFTICPGDSLLFMANGASYGQGINHQWEKSSDNGVMDPWQPISAANGIRYSTAPLTASVYYRLKTECTNSAQSVYSASIFVNVRPFYGCYCSASLGGSHCDPQTPYISNVSIAGTSLNNTSSCSNNGNSYTFYDTSATTSDTVYASQMINVSATNTVSSGKVAVWIDADHDGVYEKEEYTLITEASIANNPSSAFVSIPHNATTGYTGMRVRMVDARWTLDSADACYNISNGETEDYVLFIQSAPTCNGTPDAGTYPVSFEICNGQPLQLSSPRASYGTGITYTWQKSTNKVLWSDAIDGAGYNTRIFTPALTTDTTYYRLVVYCTASNLTVYGDTIRVGIKPFYNCYCTSDLGAGYSCQSNEYISNINFPAKKLSITSTCNSPTINDSYTYHAPVANATDTVTAGEDVMVSVTYSGSPFLSRIAAWIDYNQNSVFEPSEFSLIHSGAASSSPATGVISIPVSATGGRTGMRIRATNFSASLDSADACSALGDGETEDLVLLIQPAVPCNSTVSAGSIPDTTLMCAGKDFFIAARGTTIASGLNYYWQESDDNGVADAWDSVSGSAHSKTTQVPGITNGKYYRLKVVCSITSDESFTNSMYVMIDSFYNCYDANTNLGGGNCNNDYISNVSIDGTTLDNTTLCNNTSKGARTVFPDTGSTTATLVKGMDYTINVTPNYVKSMGVWIDFNRNGIFEIAEFTLINQRSNVKSSATIIIPAYAVPGKTGMRVRTNEPRAFGFPVGGIFNNQAATSFNQGETEDYVITIDTLKPATGVMVSDITSTSVTVSWTNGNGNSRLVVAKRDTTALIDPIDGTRYGADVVYASGNGDSTGTGNYVVFSGDRGSSVTVEGLDSLQRYEFFVYESISSSSKYFIPGASAWATTLPVKLTTFTGTLKGNDVELKWTTASEENNKGFDIQRSSDGKTFASAGFVEGAHNRQSSTRYSFTDKNPFGRENALFYRLKQYDHNGASSYSGVIRVGHEKIASAGITIAPNPFENGFRISLEQGSLSHAGIQMVDVLGNNVKADIRGNAEEGSVYVNTDHLVNGVYFVIIRTAYTTRHYKVIRSDDK